MDMRRSRTRSPLQQHPPNAPGGQPREKPCRARGQQVPSDVDDMFAGNFKEQMLSQVDDDGDPDRSGEYAELLQACTSQRRSTMARVGEATFEPNRRLTSRLSLAPAQRVGSDGSLLQAKPRHRAPAAGHKSFCREAPPARPTPPKVRHANIPQETFPDKTVAQKVESTPSAASAPSVSSESIDLLSLAEDAMPDIGVEWDCLINSFGIMDKNEIRDRLLKSGKIDVWVAKARQQRDSFLATMRQAQMRVNEQWQKVESLELSCAELEVLKSRCASLERDNEHETKTHARLNEQRDRELQEITKMTEARDQQHATLQAALQAAQVTISTAEARAEQCETAAAAAAEKQRSAMQAAIAEKKHDAEAAKLKLREIEQLLSAKTDEAARADELTEEMEQHIKNLKASNSQSRQTLADTQASYEGKLQQYELEKSRTDLEMAKIMDDLTTMRSENERLTAANKRYDDQVVPALKQECAQGRASIDTLKLSAEKLADELRTATANRDQAVSQTTMLKARLHETTQLAEVMQNRVRELEADKLAADKKANEQSHLVNELKADSVQLRCSLDTSQTETNRLRDELDESKSRYMGLTGQMDCLNREISGADIQINRLKAENAAALSKSRAMAEEFKPLKDAMNQLETTKQKLSDENARLAIKISILEGNCSDTDRQNVANACDAEFQRQQQSEMSQELVNLRSHIAALRSEIEQQRDVLVSGEAVRRKMHNTICELKGNIRVFCRVRPELPHDKSEITVSDFVRFPTSSVDDKEAIELVVDNGTDKVVKQQFSFDKVFAGHTTQGQVFGEVSSLLQSAVDGYKVCIFAYGQTGSGKTHTMTGQGIGENRGIIPRSLEMIVAETERLKQQGWAYSLYVSFLEIHNENLRDLLADPASVQDLSIKHDTITGHSVVTNAVELPVSANAEDIRMLMQRAAAQRSVGFTKMNAQSSRSHAVFRLRLEGSKEGEPSLSGVVNLIDLAGSERLKDSHATGERLKETQAINKSLSALGDVFAALVAGASHVPFRNSKLTYLLQPCLGGNSKTLMMANLSPAICSSGESLCSLRFASRVNKCELGRAKRQVRAAPVTQDFGDEAPRPRTRRQETRESAPTGHSQGTRQRTRPAAAMANNVRPTTSRATRRRMN